MPVPLPKNHAKEMSPAGDLDKNGGIDIHTLQAMCQASLSGLHGFNGLNANAPAFYPPDQSAFTLPDLRDPEQARAVEMAREAWSSLQSGWAAWQFEEPRPPADLRRHLEEMPQLPVSIPTPETLSATSNNCAPTPHGSAASTAASTDAEASTAEQVALACLEEDCICVMVRNLPNRCKLAALVAHLEAYGVLDCCFQIHLPVDPRTGVNKGYAFVQVVQDEQQRFMETLSGTQLSGFLSQKRVEAGLADPTKGKRTVSKHTELWVRP